MYGCKEWDRVTVMIEREEEGRERKWRDVFTFTERVSLQLSCDD